MPTNLLPMMERFESARFGEERKPVFRLGFAATYRPGREAVYKAVDEGVNYFF